MTDFFIRSDGLKVDFIYEPYCEICNLPISTQFASYGKCAFCHITYGHREPEIRTRAVSKYLYPTEYPKDIFSQNIRDFKTNAALAPLLGECMVNALNNRFPELLESDIIIPVQSSNAARTFNRTELLADIISKEFDIPVMNVLFAQEGYQPVHNHPSGEKHDAIQGKIGCNVTFKGETILLIDDTYIDGTTKRECARVLKEHGAGKIWCLVLGRMISKKNLNSLKEQNVSDE